MSEKGEWTRDDAILQSFTEAEEQARAEAEERLLKELREIIEESHQEKSNDQ